MHIFKIFYYPLIILERHLDTLAHVNNAAYLEILEEARWKLLTDGGFGVEDIKRDGVSPIVLECHIKYLKEITLREKVMIESQMQSYKDKIGYLKQVIKNDKNEICCEALFTVGLFDLASRKLIFPTEKWLSAIGMR